jgi:hypothetical protein
VGYSVGANSSTSSRTGTLTIAGQTHTVTQSGAAGQGDNPPSVTLTAPTSGSTVSGTITMGATYSDDFGVTSVLVYCDGVQVPNPFNTATVR